MEQVISTINDFLWTYILLAALLGCGVWFTWRTRFVQFRMIGEMIRLLGDSAKKFDHGKRHISSFQAFAVSLASRVGTGNLAGVATAIAFGGPGGEANVRYLSDNRWVLTVFRVLSGGVMVMFGALATLETVWNIVDICMALLTACNLIAIITLGKYAFRLLDDYQKQKRNGIKSPEFHRSSMPEIAEDIDCWE